MYMNKRYVAAFSYEFHYKYSKTAVNFLFITLMLTTRFVASIATVVTHHPHRPSRLSFLLSTLKAVKKSSLYLQKS